jgi:hypothetical protein
LPPDEVAVAANSFPGATTLVNSVTTPDAFVVADTTPPVPPPPVTLRSKPMTLGG